MKSEENTNQEDLFTKIAMNVYFEHEEREPNLNDNDTANLINAMAEAARAGYNVAILGEQLKFRSNNREK